MIIKFKIKILIFNNILIIEVVMKKNVDNFIIYKMSSIKFCQIYISLEMVPHMIQKLNFRLSEVSEGNKS